MKKIRSLSSQQSKIIEGLRKENLTTLDIRHRLDILGVSARIAELRQIGFNIQKHWSEGLNPLGGKHPIAKYILQPGKWENPKEKKRIAPSANLEANKKINMPDNYTSLSSENQRWESNDE